MYLHCHPVRSSVASCHSTLTRARESGASSIWDSCDSEPTSRVPLQAGYVRHPQKVVPSLLFVRRIIGPSHEGQFGVVVGPCLSVIMTQLSIHLEIGSRSKSHALVSFTHSSSSDYLKRSKRPTLCVWGGLSVNPAVYRVFVHSWMGCDISHFDPSLIGSHSHQLLAWQKTATKFFGTLGRSSWTRSRLSLQVSPTPESRQTCNRPEEGNEPAEFSPTAPALSRLMSNGDCVEGRFDLHETNALLCHVIMV